MTKKQEDTIQQLIDYAPSDPSILALILCGSIAQGTERDESDIDVFVVVTDERFEKEKTIKNYFWGTDVDTSEFKTEVDGKIIPKDFLKKVWELGNESIKNTLIHSKIIYSVDDEIVQLLTSGVGLTNKTETMRKFYALMKSSRYSVDGQWDNPLFVHKCIYDTIFYACRLVLADNDILFPCVKNLNKTIKQCVRTPENFIELMEDAMSSCSMESLDRFYRRVDEYFYAYHFDNKLRKGYVLENEWFWYFNILPFDQI